MNNCDISYLFCNFALTFNDFVLNKMKIFTAAQIKELDRYTIEHEPISSVDLMERAAVKLTQEIVNYCDENSPVVAFAGPGNNGGDALAVVRLLRDEGVNAVACCLM